MSTSRYAQRGVSADKKEVHDAIKGMDKGLYPNAFCKVMPDAAGNDKDFCNIMHADTAGTKTSLAYLYYKETGDASVWKGIAQDAIVMNLDDMACVGAFDNIILSSTIGRNKNIIPGEVIAAVINGTNELAEKMHRHDVHLHLAGGETADVGDIVRTIDVGYTAFARLPRKKVLENNIQDGNVIVGLASYGKASYEDNYNSGIGSNGLTSARHEVLAHHYAEQYPESFDPHVPDDLVFCGKHDLIDTFGNSTIGELLLSPTRTYVPFIKKLYNAHQDNINGLIHCTGGAHTKVMKFVEGMHIVKNNLPEPPPVFKMIQQSAGTDWQEMYQVFNMGVRLEIYLPEKYAQSVIELANSFNIDAWVTGYCEKAKENSLTIEAMGKTMEY